MLSIPLNYHHLRTELHVRYNLNEIFLRTLKVKKKTNKKNKTQNKKNQQTITNTKTQIANAIDESTRATFSS